MALYIKDNHADELAGMLAEKLHSNKTRIVIEALEEYARRHAPSLAKTPQDIEAEVARMTALTREIFGEGPILDHRSDDEIIGYDENGLPT